MKYLSLFCVSGSKVIYFGSDSTHTHFRVTSPVLGALCSEPKVNVRRYLMIF